MYPLMCQFNSGLVRLVEKDEVVDVLHDDSGFLLVTIHGGLVCKSAHRVQPQPKEYTNGNSQSL